VSDPTDLTVVEALAALDAKKLSAVELAEAHIKAGEAANPKINAYITITSNLARKQAAESDKRRAVGKAGALDGIPIAIKDLFCTKGVLTTGASNILNNFEPVYESTVTQKLLNSGCVMLGKSNLDEMAMGSSGISSHYKPTVSPWSGPDPANAKRKLVPGGSSSGSAALVAGRFAMAATGTDTGGSIRQPASLSGIVGMKPTYGRCSRWGIIAFASSLDQAGPMTRTVGDAALVLREMSGYDDKDSTSVDTPVPDFTKAIGASVKGLKIGIPREYRIDGMPPEIDALWKKGASMLKDAGAEIIDVSLPHTKYALAVYYIIAPAEASSNLARYDGVRYGLRVPGENLNGMYENTRGKGFGQEVQRRILIGTYVLSAGYYDAYYIKAQRVRRCIRNDFDAAFKQCDAILAPTTPNSAFAIGEKQHDPIQMYLNDVFTVPGNLAGIPGISVPAGLSADGLPLGLQVLGKAFDEMTVLKLTSALEKACAFNHKPPFAA
jgi:aspartyl-tRNA(Asn)/glutamyl-tRNA(Gln) amidotransferase subunit A